MLAGAPAGSDTEGEGLHSSDRQTGALHTGGVTGTELSSEITSSSFSYSSDTTIISSSSDTTITSSSSDTAINSSFSFTKYHLCSNRWISYQCLNTEIHKYCIQDLNSIHLMILIIGPPLIWCRHAHYTSITLHPSLLHCSAQ